MKRNNKNSPFSLKLRGSRNILFPKSLIYEKIMNTSFNFLKSNGYQQIIIPSYDYESTFKSSLGEDSDIVQKEMFTFSDKKGRKLALRPEGTAYVSKMIFQGEISKYNNSEKIFYWSNMFRYERPQKGRYREFWQLGVEFINTKSHFTSDCEIIYLVKSLLEKNNIKDFVIYLNYLGDKKTKDKYKSELKSLFYSKSNLLCDLCKKRYYLNPLRIVDCDVCGELEEIPDYDNFLSKEELNYFEKIKNFALKIGIEFIVNKKLVRGIGYYSGFVFECKTKNEKKSILGGGRYDSLFPGIEEKKIQENISSVGFAIGIDRIVDFCKEKEILELKKRKKTDLLLISFSEDSFCSALLFKNELQNNIDGIIVEVIIKEKRKLSKTFSNFDPLFSVFFGEKEIKNNVIPVVNHSSKEKFLVKKELFASWISNHLKNFWKVN